MLILLPPSETKKPGGRSGKLALDRLALPSLTAHREESVDALVDLSRRPLEAARVLGLGPRQLDEIEVNAALRTSPTMAAVDRYTGVLYDALAADALESAARRWLGANVMIHSAPFGPVGALDPIPAYRLGAAASIPSLGPLRRHWASAITAALEASGASFILDLRSEAYVGLGPVPGSVRHAYVRVVTRTDDGEVRALNHFNKHAKGEFVRRLAEDRPRVRTGDALLRWAEGSGVALTAGPAHTYVLAV